MAASALVDPEQPPISVLNTTLTWAIPPLMCPARSIASLTIRLVIPEAFIRVPAKINKGTASKVTFWVWEIGSCTMVIRGNSGCCRKKVAPAIPTAKPTGIPRKSSTRKTIVTSSIYQLLVTSVR